MNKVITTEFVMPKEIDKEVRYIICPDVTCKGFTERFDWCRETEYGVELSKKVHNIDSKICPHIDKAKSVVFCPHDHPIERKVNIGGWHRADCNYEDCHSCSFVLASNVVMRIPLDRYDEFLKLPFKKD